MTMTWRRLIARMVTVGKVKTVGKYDSARQATLDFINMIQMDRV